ncbi:MAG: SDR family oxidoreductase [Halobacteriaceae archaeon]
MPTVVLTGATGGIGTAVATAFTGPDTTLVLGGRDEAKLSELAENLDGKATAVRTDVRDEYDVERLAETAARVSDGGIDVVIPSAAVYHGSAGDTPLAEESYAAFDDTIRTNIRGVHATIKETVPHLAADGRVLVPTGSVASDPGEGYGAYAVSKAGAEAVMRGYAAELPQPVGCIDPGVVATDLTGGKGRDPADVAGLFTWAAEVDPDTLNGETLGLREWRQAQRE